MKITSFVKANSFRIFIIFLILSSSRLESGSSHKIILESLKIAIAILIRCLSPPDRNLILVFKYSKTLSSSKTSNIAVFLNFTPARISINLIF